MALSYLLKATDTRLKASWGQGFRAPTFNELFFPAFPPCPPFGNPDLKPEESDSWDAGVEQHLWERRVRLAATYFRNDFTNLIQPTLIDPVNFCFQAQNVGEGAHRGRRGGGERDADRRAASWRSPTRTPTPRTGRRASRSGASPRTARA